MNGAADRRARQIALLAAGMSAAVGATGLAGWALGAPLLSAAGSSFIPIAPSAAASLCALGVALALVAVRRAPAAAALCGAVVALNAIFRFVEWAAGVPLLDPDALIVTRPEMFARVPTARMSPLTAITMSMSGWALVLLAAGARRRAARHAAGILGIAVAWVAFAVILGYLQGRPLLYGSDVIPMALTTAIGCLAAGAGTVFAAGLDVVPLAPLVGPSVRARLLRALVPATMAAVLVTGLITSLLGRWGVAPAVLAVLPLLIVTHVVMLLVIAVAGRLGGAIDLAERVLARSRDELELRVRERT
ncbi:MAG TPA: hypothetical protein VNI78_07015, partial [Vicinamibacterales bacterium]|nr:hypothetical protein [Vicinamibacterales bacterium]